MKRLTPLILLLLLLVATPLWAEDLYVRPLGTDYEAENGLTYATAWEGLVAVQWGTSAGEVGPGDTLYVCGTHINTQATHGVKYSFAVGASGTSSSYITIKGHPDYPAIIWNAHLDGRAGGIVAGNWVADWDGNAGVYYNTTTVGGRQIQDTYGLYENISDDTFDEYTKVASSAAVIAGGAGIYFEEE